LFVTSLNTNILNTANPRLQSQVVGAPELAVERSLSCSRLRDAPIIS
jgi:hypothetical protein